VVQAERNPAAGTLPRRRFDLLHARSRLLDAVEMKRRLSQVPDQPGGDHRVMGRVLWIEEALREVVRVGVSARPKACHDPAELREGDSDVRAHRHGDPFRLSRGLLGRVLIAAHTSNERDCRIGRSLRLRICELFRQTSGLSRSRDRDIPIGQPRRHIRIEHKYPWQMPKASFVTQGLYRGSQKVDPEIESPHGERRRAEVSCYLGIATALISRRPQARQYFRGMAVWISVGVDCEHTRIGRVGPAQSMRCID
jgi:hypothetical protein